MALAGAGASDPHKVPWPTAGTWLFPWLEAGAGRNHIRFLKPADLNCASRSMCSLSPLTSCRSHRSRPFDRSISCACSLSHRCVPAIDIDQQRTRPRLATCVCCCS